MSWEEFRILKKLHPSADKYFMRVALIAGTLLVVQLLFQMTTAIGLLK